MVASDPAGPGLRAQNGFPPGTVASGRGLWGHGHPPSSNLVSLLVWVGLEDRELGDPAQAARARYTLALCAQDPPLSEKGALVRP
ncbi:unnamed protein product [Rangifer tarandus platyrhynchus]|uniref:Uncharacterized protein n=1 Tax=Rangifer tarandus platyrhynchus TaxID=3082113 RepID=A0AC59Y4V4_RANTA